MNSSTSAPATRGPILLLLLIPATVFGAMAFGRGADSIGWAGLVGLAAAAVVAFVLFLVPVHWLPSIVVITLGFVPLALIPSLSILNAVPPAAMIMIVWVLRRVVLGEQRLIPGKAPVQDNAIGRYLVWVIAGAFVAWCLWLTMGSLSRFASIGWTIAFTVSALIPLLVVDARAEVQLLRRVLLIVGALAGGYAVVEMLLGASPVYGPLYQILGGPETSEATWSVYRARAAFSHPLFAASFLVIPAGLGFGSWATGGPHRDLLYAGIAALGVVATVSRGAVVALAVVVVFAVIAALIFARSPRRVGRTSLLLGTGAVGLLLLTQFPPLRERIDSTESALSAAAREVGLHVGFRAAESADWLGTGPGTSGIASRMISPIVIESSPVQLLISVGIPGFALLLILLLAACGVALGRGDIGAAAALVGYLVATSGYNSVDAVRLLHVLIGVLLLLCLHPGDPDPWNPARARRATTSAVGPRYRATVGDRV